MDRGFPSASLRLILDTFSTCHMEARIKETFGGKEDARNEGKG